MQNRRQRRPAACVGVSGTILGDALRNATRTSVGEGDSRLYLLDLQTGEFMVWLEVVKQGKDYVVRERCWCVCATCMTGRFAAVARQQGSAARKIRHQPRPEHASPAARTRQHRCQRQHPVRATIRGQKTGALGCWAVPSPPPSRGRRRA